MIQLQKSCLRSKVCSSSFAVIPCAAIACVVHRSLHAHLPRCIDSLLKLHIKHLQNTFKCSADVHMG